jgi:hypothetical protein
VWGWFPELRGRVPRPRASVGRLGVDERDVDDVLGQEPHLHLVAAQDVTHQQIVAAEVLRLLGRLDAVRPFWMIVSCAASSRSRTTGISSAPSGARSIVVGSAA